VTYNRQLSDEPLADAAADEGAGGVHRGRIEGMSTIREYDDDENVEVIDDPELNAELEAAIAEADAHPEDNIPWDVFIRRLRNGA